MKSNQTCRVCGQGGTVGVVVCVECHQTFGPFCPEHGPQFAAYHTEHCEARSECERRREVQEVREVYSNDLLTRVMLATGRAFMQPGPKAGDWKC